MTNRERENFTLSFMKPSNRGAVEETFHPWTLTVKRFKDDGLLSEVADNIINPVICPDLNNSGTEKYLNDKWSQGAFKLEKYLGFDPVKRISFMLPFRHYKASGHVDGNKAMVSCEKDWEIIKEFCNKELDEHITYKNIQKVLLPVKEGHDRGDYPVRINIHGFFWAPRDLFGIEAHMYAFYDFPDLMHDINSYILDKYLEKLVKVLEVLPADIVYIMEDLSGKNGPMLSPDLFDEFVGSYYKKLIPVLKQKGVKHVFVDTDGDFNKIIPNFIKAGVDGFLPMDVNAGMDIVKVRREFPKLKFIGGYNKLCIAEGKEAIDREFERLMPVIRQGGYIPGCDHQVAPSTSLNNYMYYIKRLHEVMQQAGVDL